MADVNLDCTYLLGLPDKQKLPDAFNYHLPIGKKYFQLQLTCLLVYFFSAYQLSNQFYPLLCSSVNQ